MMTEQNPLGISRRAFRKTGSPITNFPVANSSWKLTEWVAQRSCLSGNSKLVAITIASFYSKKDGFAYISYEKISAVTGLSEATIGRAVQDMKLSGEWLVIKLVTFHNENVSQVKSTPQRYVPLPPTDELPGSWLDLFALSKYLNERNSRASRRFGGELSRDFYRIYDSDWSSEFLEMVDSNISHNGTRNATKDTLYGKMMPGGREQKLYDCFINEISKRGKESKERIKVRKEFFRFLRGPKFGRHEEVKAFTYPPNSTGKIYSWKPADQKLALLIYDFWVHNLRSNKQFKYLFEYQGS